MQIDEKSDIDSVFNSIVNRDEENTIEDDNNDSNNQNMDNNRKENSEVVNNNPFGGHDINLIENFPELDKDILLNLSIIFPKKFNSLFTMNSIINRVNHLDLKLTKNDINGFDCNKFNRNLFDDKNNNLPLKQLKDAIKFINNKGEVSHDIIDDKINDPEIKKLCKTKSARLRKNEKAKKFITLYENQLLNVYELMLYLYKFKCLSKNVINSYENSLTTRDGILRLINDFFALGENGASALFNNWNYDTIYNRFFITFSKLKFKDENFDDPIDTSQDDIIVSLLRELGSNLDTKNVVNIFNDIKTSKNFYFGINYLVKYTGDYDTYSQNAINSNNTRTKAITDGLAGKPFAYIPAQLDINTLIELPDNNLFKKIFHPKNLRYHSDNQQVELIFNDLISGNKRKPPAKSDNDTDGNTLGRKSKKPKISYDKTDINPSGSKHSDVYDDSPYDDSEIVILRQTLVTITATLKALDESSDIYKQNKKLWHQTYKLINKKLNQNKQKFEINSRCNRIINAINNIKGLINYEKQHLKIFMENIKNNEKLFMKYENYIVGTLNGECTLNNWYLPLLNNKDFQLIIKSSDGNITNKDNSKKDSKTKSKNNNDTNGDTNNTNDDSDLEFMYGDEDAILPDTITSDNKNKANLYHQDHMKIFKGITALMRRDNDNKTDYLEDITLQNLAMEGITNVSVNKKVYSYVRVNIAIIKKLKSKLNSDKFKKFIKDKFNIDASEFIKILIISKPMAPSYSALVATENINSYRKYVNEYVSKSTKINVKITSKMLKNIGIDGDETVTLFILKKKKKKKKKCFCN